MTHNFKPGDKITMKPGAKSLQGYDAGGKTGEVHDPLVRGFKQYTLSVEFPGEYGRKLMRPEDILPTVTTPTDDQIRAALATVKRENNYCEEFDCAVKEAENLDFLGRLKAVAVEKDRLDIYHQLLTALKPEPEPEYKEGDRVHYTVNNIDFVQALIDGKWVYEYNPRSPDCISHDYDRKPFPHPDRKIINTVNLKPGREFTVPDVPEIGKWIEATYVDGHTDTFKVTRAAKFDAYAIIYGGQNKTQGDYLNLVFRPTEWEQPERKIASWKYVDAPAKIVGIDGYLVRWLDGRARAYNATDRDGAEKGGSGLVEVGSVKDGYERIARYSHMASHREYVPALLAAIKFIKGGN